MEKELKCPFCGSTDVIRMDGSGTVKKYGPGIMIDIAPEIIHCKTCGKDFRDDLFDKIEIDD